MHGDIERVLIPQSAIAQRVRELAGRITKDHSPPVMDGSPEVTIVPVLTGAMIFCADLVRQLPMRMRIGLLAVSSYPGRSIRSQEPSILAEQLGEMRGRHVLLIDDILDSGQTIERVRSLLLERSPASVKTCVLLRKDTEGAKRTPVDYVGFDIPDQFVVGYGLDYDDFYRNLPDVVTLKGDIIRAGR